MGRGLATLESRVVRRVVAVGSVRASGVGSAVVIAAVSSLEATG